MNIQTLDQSPQNHRGGQVSHLLLASGQFGSENLAVTWVEGEPGSEQAVHSTTGGNRCTWWCRDGARCGSGTKWKRSARAR